MDAPEPQRAAKVALWRARSRIGEPSAGTLGFLLLIPSLVAISLVVVYPLLYTLYLSLTDKVLTDPGSGRFAGLENYRDVFANSDIRNAAINSVTITVISLVIQLVLGFVLAMMLRAPFRGRGLLRGVFIIPWPLPTFVAAFAWVWMLDYNFGVVNHFLAAVHLSRHAFLGDPTLAYFTVILADVWKHLPWTLIVMIAGMSLVSREQLEAVRVDGGRLMAEIWHVILPVMRPVIVLAIVLRTIWSINTFDLIYLLTGGGPARATDVLPLQIYATAFQTFRIGQAAALASCVLIGLGALAILYLRLQHEEPVA